MLFVDYPTMGDPTQDQIECFALPEELPPGAQVIPACAALRASGLTNKQLFLDNNHMSVAGNAIVGKVMAETLRARYRR